MTQEILFKCRILGRARSKKNSKQIFRTKSGRPFISSSNEYKRWAIFASMVVNTKKIDKIIDFPCNLSVKCFYTKKTHMQDLDNIIASVCDVLEDCQIIKNDNLFYSYDGSKKIYESDFDAVEIEITKI